MIGQGLTGRQDGGQIRRRLTETHRCIRPGPEGKSGTSSGLWCNCPTAAGYLSGGTPTACTSFCTPGSPLRRALRCAFFSTPPLRRARQGARDNHPASSQVCLTLQCGAAAAMGVEADALASHTLNYQLNGYGYDQIQQSFHHLHYHIAISCAWTIAAIGMRCNK